MKLALPRPFLAICCCLILSACSTMLPLRTYTGAAVNGLAAIENIDYSFLSQCEANCRDRDLAAYRINRLPCNCADSKLADSVNVLLYQTIYAYVNSLGKLAEPALVRMPVREFNSSLLNVKLVKVTEAERSAVQEISDLVSSALTSKYRNKKMKSYVQHAHEPLTTLLDALEFNLNKNLRGVIEVRKQRIRTDYYELLSEKELSTFEKRRITADYYLIVEHLNQHLLDLSHFSGILHEIKAGHEVIYKNLSQLSDKELQTRVSLHAVKIEALIKAIPKSE